MTCYIQKEIISGRALPETMTQAEVVTGRDIKVRLTHEIEEKGIVNQNSGLGCSQQNSGEIRGGGKGDRKEYDS